MSAIQNAIASHQAGRLGEAEAVYRGILDHNPDHPGALHLLGVLRHQQSRQIEAIKLIGCAIEIRPGEATYYNNYGLAPIRLAGRPTRKRVFSERLAFAPIMPTRWPTSGWPNSALGDDATAEEEPPPSPPLPTLACRRHYAPGRPLAAPGPCGGGPSVTGIGSRCRAASRTPFGPRRICFSPRARRNMPRGTTPRQCKLASRPGRKDH